MKLFVFFLGILLALHSLDCSKATAPNLENPTPVPFTQYDRYSYGGPRASSDTTFFYLTTTKPTFDSLFHFIFDHNVPDTIPCADFSTKQIFSVVKYGNNIYELKTTSVDLIDGVLRVQYTCNLVSENMTWTAAIPMIITAKAEFRKVRFIENGVQLCEIPI
jgi:hypothetical protein